MDNFNLLGFEKIEKIYYYDHREDIYSEIFLNRELDTAIILDHSLGEIDYMEGPFSYREYTNAQNLLMKKYKYLYRFSGENIPETDFLKKILDQSYEIPLSAKRDFKREGVDASYLEHHFEKIFFELYGESSYNLLTKEESLIGFRGENIFADYVIEKKDEKIIIEENGENYHHPQKTGIEKYLKQLSRQNALVYQGFKVYRFSTNEIQFQERMVEEMEFFFGKGESFITKGLFQEERKFQLYDHQSITLENLSEMRESGVKSALIVLPTGTGKSTIGIEELKSYLENNPDKKSLVIVPSNALKDQWNLNLNEAFKDDFHSLRKNIQILTQSGAIRRKNSFSQDEFGYILVDEAHHSVAEGISKVIRYFNPDFLLGMTATPERLDRKKLEDIFSAVETKLNLKEAIEKGICSPIRVFRLESSIDLSEVRFNGKEYLSGDLEKKIIVTSRNELIADTVEKYFGNSVEGLGEKQGIIFCVNIKHAQMMEKLLISKGISARAVSGEDKNSQFYLEEYLQGKIRFLCSCQLINEGWDAPQTSILIMARPTMSKVLYYQQLGRGTRKAEGKESLYVVDVVDNYGFSSTPWSVNALLGCSLYRPFGDVLTGNFHAGGELFHIEHLLEREKDLVEIDIETFQDKYGDMLSAEELARELFISTSTVNNWIKNGDIKADYSSQLGRQKLFRFKPERIEEIREQKKLKKRDETTILDDFWEFVNEGDYSLSYKIIFLLSLLKNISRDGEAEFEKVLETYAEYYRKRIHSGFPVDRKSCPFTLENLKDKKFVTKNIVDNPFEKFERKRFMYYGKDVKNIGFSFNLWKKFDSEQLQKLKEKMFSDLESYYRNLGGIGDISDF